MNDIEVSVVCITYNQAEYIKDAINSFLMQKTEFNYEIIVHDDASTDQTIEILKYYEKNYPEKVKVIYEEENQYSKGINISDYMFTLVKGKYIAFCEGDDFWTDELKLQKQYEYMQKHPTCAAYIHNGWKISKDKKTVFNSKPLCKYAKKYGIEDAICGLGIKTYTNSFFMRADIFKKRPEFLNYAPTRDYVMIVECALKGYLYYSPEYMSAQRVAANSSLTQLWNNNPELWRNYINEQMILLDKINQETDYIYDEIIEEEKINQMFSNLLILKDKERLAVSPYKELYGQLSLKQKLRYFYPNIFEKIAKLVRILRNEKRFFISKVHYEKF